MVKFLLIAIFLGIVASLGSALYHLVKHKSDAGASPQVAKLLTVRITISALLFILVFILVATGVIKPHGIGIRMHSQPPAESAQP